MSAELVPIMMPVRIDGKYQEFPVWHENLARHVVIAGECNNLDQDDAKVIFPDTVHMNKRTALNVIKCGETDRICRHSYYKDRAYRQTLTVILVNAIENTIHMRMCLYRLPIPEVIAHAIARMVGEQREIFFGKYTNYRIIERKRRVMIRNTRPEDMVPSP